MAVANKQTNGGDTTPFWRDLRFWQIFLQIAFLVIVTVVVLNLTNNIVTSLQEINQTPNFEYLQNRAGFEIGGVDNYSPDDSFFEAFLVGVRNTLSVVTLGLVASTILGILFGIFLLSNNWLVRTLSRVYVEILRNTPLLVQLLLWYFVVFVSLPTPQESTNFPANGVLDLTWRWVIYIVVGLFIAFYFKNSEKHVRNRMLIGGLAAASVIEIGFWRVVQLQLSGTESAIASADALRSGALTTPFIIYGIVSAILIALVYFLIKQIDVKSALLGLLGGQLLGGLLFYNGIIPGGSLLRFEGVLLSLSVRGVFLPQLVTTPRYPIWMVFITIGVIIALAQWVYLGQITERTGKQFPRAIYAISVILILGVIGWFIVRVGAPPITEAYISQETVVTIDEGAVTMVIEDEVTVIKDREGIQIMVPTDDIAAENQPLTVYEAIRGRYVTPRQISALDPNPISFFPVIRDDRGRRYVAGEGLSPEYMAVLVGLVIYTSAFIAEIVRAGIQAVPKGQREAAGAIGLSNSDTLTMIVLPQALRVIIPPMGNQYLNLAKNSSLAIAVSYFDIFNVMNTIINQTGQSVSGIIIIMVSYLIMSLTISFVMNLVNQRFQLVTR